MSVAEFPSSHEFRQGGVGGYRVAPEGTLHTRQALTTDVDAELGTLVPAWNRLSTRTSAVHAWLQVNEAQAAEIVENTDLKSILIQMSTSRRNTFGAHLSDTWLDLLKRHIEDNAFGSVAVQRSTQKDRQAVAGSAIAVAIKRILIGVSFGTALVGFGVAALIASLGDWRLWAVLIVAGVGLIVSGIEFARDAQRSVTGVDFWPARAGTRGVVTDIVRTRDVAPAADTGRWRVRR